MQRIMIIGGPGAGKTWLANVIAEHRKLPLISIDDMVWTAERHLRPVSEIDAAAIKATKGDRWIIEGGNTRTYADRLARADTVIRLCPPRWLRILRLLRRKPLSRELLVWAWRYDAVFGPKDQMVVEDAKHRIQFFVLASRRDVQRFVEGLPTDL